jgi:hypothetical protein
MLKKIVFGNGDAFITDNETKTKIIDWLYNKLDLSKHRYNVLNNIQKLQYLQENPHYVSPNFKGFNYLLIMTMIQDKKYCVLIDRKKLSYHKNQLDMKTISIIQVHMKTSDSIFRGTIFDGKMVSNGKVFLIQDCFYLMGNKILDIMMQDKINQLDSILSSHFRKDNLPYCNNFEFKLNKLYGYDELEKLISSLSTLSIQNNGIIFFPSTSGITTIYTEKKVEKVTINTTNNEVIEQKSYHIIKDFIEFLKSRSYSYEEGSKTKSLWLSRTNVPDVYDISEKENGEKEGIALIPNLKISQMCDDVINDTPIRFNCVFCNKFKKWIPLNRC